MPTSLIEHKTSKINVRKVTAVEVGVMLEGIASRNPERVYRQVPFNASDGFDAGESECAYFDADGAPSCIIGHAFDELIRAGRIPEREFGAAMFVQHSDRARCTGEPINFENVAGLRSRLMVDAYFTLEALNIMAAVQDRQDWAVPWGEAVADALTMRADRLAGEELAAA